MIAQLLNYDPYRELTDFSRRLLTDLEPRRAPRTVPVDIREEDDKFVLEADLPGFAPEDLEIVAAPEKLTLKGTRKAKRAEADNETKPLHRERGGFSFERSFTLPRGIDLEGIEAKLDAGVLTLTLPKRAADRPRSITVRATAA